ncbi:sigma-70 family RNA polymerase sigma factor [Metabacillus sp. RGM 3146]|uniref:sigma-70 family RNA polymerase sigma factor n=1 Tax=Metabacillus sp. RGM 3146 TaxID=3401092 RepID=UPI003B9C041C
MKEKEFEELLGEYTPMIYHLIKKLHIYQNQQDFFYIASEALWQASLSADKEKGSVHSYYYNCMKGKLLNELTSQRKYYEKCIISSDFPEEAAECSEYEDTIVKNTIMSFSGFLTDNQQKWLKGYCYEGLTLKQIANREKTTLASVKNWRKGALAAFHKNVHRLHVYGLIKAKTE